MFHHDLPRHPSPYAHIFLLVLWLKATLLRKFILEHLCRGKQECLQPSKMIVIPWCLQACIPAVSCVHRHFTQPAPKAKTFLADSQRKRLLSLVLCPPRLPCLYTSWQSWPNSSGIREQRKQTGLEMFSQVWNSSFDPQWKFQKFCQVCIKSFSNTFFHFRRYLERVLCYVSGLLDQSITLQP